MTQYGKIFTSSLISSAHSSISRYEYIFTGVRVPSPSALFAFFISSIIRLSLFIPQSTVRLLGGLGLSFSLSHFAFQICLFTPRATLPHLKCYLSSTECFGAVPHVNTRLFFFSFPPLRKKTNASYLLLMLRRSLNSYFRGKKGAPDPVIVTALFPRILR